MVFVSGQVDRPGQLYLKNLVVPAIGPEIAEVNALVIPGLAGGGGQVEDRQADFPLPVPVLQADGGLEGHVRQALFDFRLGVLQDNPVSV